MASGPVALMDWTVMAWIAAPFVVMGASFLVLYLWPTDYGG